MRNLREVGVVLRSTGAGDDVRIDATQDGDAIGITIGDGNTEEVSPAELRDAIDFVLGDGLPRRTA